MIISITEYCTMGCNHCCMNSTKEGKHMERDTFYKALDFYGNFKFPLLLITGGEPTDHPNFEEYMDEILKRGYKLIILSNGLWTLDDRKDVFLNKYKFQIINDERYYPIYVPEIVHPNILIYGKVENSINKCTRSIKNNIYTEGLKPKCFNLRILFKLENSFLNAIYKYNFVLKKFCIPIIKFDGSMILGESDLCKPFGTIYDNFDVLLEKGKTFRCNNCSCFENLDSLRRNYLKE